MNTSKSTLPQATNLVLRPTHGLGRRHPIFPGPPVPEDAGPLLLVDANSIVNSKIAGHCSGAECAGEDNYEHDGVGAGVGKPVLPVGLEGVGEGGWVGVGLGDERGLCCWLWQWQWQLTLSD